MSARMMAGVAVGAVVFLTLAILLIALSIFVPGECLLAAAAVCDQRHDVVAAEVLNLETALAIIVSGIGTAALVVTVYYSSKATRAAIEASDVANLAVAHSRESAVREQRPYMTTDGWSNFWVLSQTDPTVTTHRQLAIIWKNGGKTPATNVCSRTNHCFHDGPLPPDFPFPDRDLDDAVGSIGPGGTFNSRTALIPLEDIAAAIRGGVTLHLWSWVEYEGFEPGRRYRSEYHATVSYWGATDPASHDLQTTLNLQRRFNGMDDTCFRHPTTPAARRLA